MRIKYICSVFPENIVKNEELSHLPSKWSPEKIENKIGIRSRAIAAADETSADLATKAGRLLFEKHDIDPSTIDFLLFCTQSPDFFLPTSACIIQDRLGIPTSCGALDFNLGCSGYVYGLALAKGLTSAGISRNLLFLTGETYSKFIYEKDWSVKTIFGDAATATLISADDAFRAADPACINSDIGDMILATDGRGWENLIVPYGGMRQPDGPRPEIESDNGSIRREGDLYMHGSKIFNFTLEAVPAAVDACLEKNGLGRDDIDLYVFHQANKHMLSALMKKCSIPKEKYYINMLDCGNTVSNTIPIALEDIWAVKRISRGAKVMLVGFGVGYSWGATVIEIF